jgi:hypothetical protein
MEKSRMTREWVERVWADNPCVLLDNGNIRFVARAAFVSVLERPKPGADGKERAFGLVALLPDLGGPVNIDALKKAVMDIYAEKAPAALNSAELRAKLNQPIKAQDGYVDKEGKLYDGFVPGRLCISANSSKSKPPVVDLNGSPIVEKSQIYSGCWVIVAVKPAWFDVDTNKGPTFYLQSVMVIAHDENLGGAGQGNPEQDFKGVKVDASVNPAGAFGVDAATAGNTDQAKAAADLFS